MKILRAEVLGMCFGVRDALEVIDAVEDPGLVTIHGELVHNEEVLHQLDLRGFTRSDEARRQDLPDSPLVLITAHGISNQERMRLGAAGKKLIDTTCPLVRRVHQAALSLRDDGYLVLVIGRRGHVEVQGIVEDLERFEVIQSSEEVRCYSADRLGIICQTTAPSRLVESVREEIARQNPGAEIRFHDTVCLPTKDHQRSLEKLLDRVDAMVVVGGRNSNNTKELVTRSRERGVPALHVQSPADLIPDWFAAFQTVGLTAGTSTPDATIDAVHEALERLTVEVGA